MGDYYWYGCEGHREPWKAAHMYANAAYVKDPHVRYMFSQGLFQDYH